MTYYHQTKDAAREAAQQYEDEWQVELSLVPWNGWVIVLQPLSHEALKRPLYDLLDHVEIVIPKRLSRRPPEHKEAPPRATDQPKRQTRARPVAPPPPPPPPPPRK